jgi:uncharacterized protein (DUF362 family)
MERREFLKKLISTGAAGASALLLPKFAPLFGQNRKNGIDLVAVRNGEPEKMFDTGIKALGGMKNFVSKGDVVVVKPNIGWNVEPDRGANTNPVLVGRIVEHCIAAGAKKVYVFDHTCSYWRGAYTNSGIEKAAKNAGATVAPGNREGLFEQVRIPNAKILKTVQVHELYLEADVIINVPVLKVHSGARMTSAMKNLMGVVWDRGFYHSRGLHQCIADFPVFRKPALNVVDAYTIMVKNGPRGYSRGDLVLQKMQLISPDIVAIDAASAKILNMEPENIPYIPFAHSKKMGNINLDQLTIKKIAL